MNNLIKDTNDEMGDLSKVIESLIQYTQESLIKIKEKELDMDEKYADILVDAESHPGDILTWGLIPLGIIIFVLIWMWKKSKKT